ncbi:MAG: IS21 family transposase [Chromatiaceae bacterium]|nr:IS21 family transposase [Chromatiaceae bacterium]
MIHTIKAMYDGGRGSSLRAIAQELGLSRNTVRKYATMPEEDIAGYRDERERTKRLDGQRDYIVHLLETYPRLSAVKILRKLTEAHGELEVSIRTARRYVRALKETAVVKRERYYEPVLDMVPGVQCQVDGGEQRAVLIGGAATTVYFMVFVLSYSRLLYVAASLRPIDTAALIRMHDAAFRSFGGFPQECVYDQTRLVVSAETFRELALNERFARYATTVGFRIRACEGYDPESKGKVEAGVKYVKQDALYGETFADFPALEVYVAQWLDETANVRLHAATGEAPRVRFERDERTALGAYFSPRGIAELGPAPLETRKADKTGLIAYRANKYSVPLAYQRSPVGVREADGQLLVCALDTGEVVARHPLGDGKGETFKNTNHYRDRAQQIAELEGAIHAALGAARGQRLCALLKATSPAIYKDQLRGAARVLAAHPSLPEVVLDHVCDRPRLTATGLRDYVLAYAAHPERLAAPGHGAVPVPAGHLTFGPLRRHQRRASPRGGP